MEGITINSPVLFYNDFTGQYFPPEEWRYITERSVPNICDNVSYTVSSYGRVFSFKRNNLLNQQITDNGYYRSYLKMKHGSLYVLTHRIMMMEFCPVEGMTKLVVDHKDNIRYHNVLWNLKWATHSENIQRAYNEGTKQASKRAEQKITEDIANQIAYMITTQQYTNREIAKILNINENILFSIALGNTWKYVYDKYQLYKYTIEYKTTYSPEQVELMCQYYILNKDKYILEIDLYKQMMKDLFNITFDGYVRNVLFNIFKDKTIFQDITSKYNI